MSVFALEFVSDVSISSEKVSFGFDQDGNELRVGYDVLSLYTSDGVQLGVEVDVYNLFAPGDALPFTGLNGLVSYEYTDDDESVVGFSVGIDVANLNLDTSLDWNINTSDFDAKVGTGYDFLNLDGSFTSKWDVDDFSYNGLDVDIGYTWNVSDNFSVRPNITLPIDSDWKRGDLGAGVSIKITYP